MSRAVHVWGIFGVFQSLREKYVSRKLKRKVVAMEEGHWEIQLSVLWKNSQVSSLVYFHFFSSCYVFLLSSSVFCGVFRVHSIVCITGWWCWRLATGYLDKLVKKLIQFHENSNNLKANATRNDPSNVVFSEEAVQKGDQIHLAAILSESLLYFIL